MLDRLRHKAVPDEIFGYLPVGDELPLVLIVVHPVHLAPVPEQDQRQGHPRHRLRGRTGRDILTRRGRQGEGSVLG